MSDLEREEEGPRGDGSDSNTAMLQLQESFVNALTACGALGKIRAQLRATALALMRGDTDLQGAAIGDAISPLTMSTTSKVALLLMYDFLQSHGFTQTAGVLEVEGTIQLLAGEEAGIVEGIRDLGSGGSAMDQLIEYWLRTRNMGLDREDQGHSSIHSSRTESPGRTDSIGAPKGGRAQDSIVVSVPQDIDILNILDAYEDSIPFSDREGDLDDMNCDEIEKLKV